MSRPILLIAILILLMPMALADIAGQDDNIILWLHMDDAQGSGVLIDAGPLSADMNTSNELNNPTPADTAIVGTALNFTFADAADLAGVLDGQTPKTIMFWIKPKFDPWDGISKAPSNYEPIIHFDVTDSEMALVGDNIGTCAGTDVMAMFPYNPSDTHCYETSIMKNLTWYFVAWVYNESNSSWYVQVNNTYSKAVKTGSGTGVITLNKMSIGEYLYPSVSVYLAAELDELSMYNVSLTPEEITQAYENMSAGFTYGNWSGAATPVTPPTGAVTGAGEQATEYAIVLMAMLLMVGLVMAVVPMASMGPMMKKVVIGTALAVLIVLILITIL